MTPYGLPDPGNSNRASRPYASAFRNSCLMRASEPSPSTAFGSRAWMRNAFRKAASERGRYDGSAVSRQRS